jgi:hypothetical protein
MMMMSDKSGKRKAESGNPPIRSGVEHCALSIEPNRWVARHRRRASVFIARFGGVWAGGGVQSLKLKAQIMNAGSECASKIREVGDVAID